MDIVKASDHVNERTIMQHCVQGWFKNSRCTKYTRPKNASPGQQALSYHIYVPDKHHIEAYIADGKHMFAYGEVKARENAVSTYDTLYLELRKWQWLTMHRAMGPALFIAGFWPEDYDKDDAATLVYKGENVRWIDMSEVEVKPLSILGRNKARAGMPNERAPMFEVPIAHMHPVTDVPWEALAEHEKGKEARDG